MEVFDTPLKGVVTRGYYKNTLNLFLWSVENDLGVWYFSATANTWFNGCEIEFDENT